jgi:hypothetical protein
MVQPLDRDIDDWDAVIEGTGRVAARSTGFASWGSP